MVGMPAHLQFYTESALVQFLFLLKPFFSQFLFLKPFVSSVRALAKFTITTYSQSACKGAADGYKAALRLAHPTASIVVKPPLLACASSSSNSPLSSPTSDCICSPSYQKLLGAVITFSSEFCLALFYCFRYWLCKKLVALFGLQGVMGGGPI